MPELSSASPTFSPPYQGGVARVAGRGGQSAPLTLVSWPNAILHVDGDSYFTAVEQALNPALKGKPVVTGAERGIASAVSYEARALGIKRGMPIALLRRNYPQCIVVAGHYEDYMVFARRMFEILRRYTPLVEEYSIDEAFADITGLRRVLNRSYEQIAQDIQRDIQRELDISVSVGVSLSKSLAKLCSKFRKPHGITVVKGRYIHILLQKTPIDRVWGFGPNITAFLRKYGCRTVYDFVQKPLSFVEENLTKKEIEIYKELRGELVYPVEVQKKETYQSISKAKTFAPSRDRQFLFAQLVKNIEEATAKCRRYHLAARTLVVGVKTQQFQFYGSKARLSRKSNSAIELVSLAERLFADCFRPGPEYRQTLCILADLSTEDPVQLTLFDQQLSVEKLDQIAKAVDFLNGRYGRGTLHLADSLPARHKSKSGFLIPELHT